MFICGKCLKPSDKLRNLLQSVGPCEVCGELAVCNDVEIHPQKANKAMRKWLLKAASKEQNPYFQAEILYQVLKETK